MSGDEQRSIIERVLSAAPVPVLAGSQTPPMSPETFTKAGILPFLASPATENWRFLLMQPVAMHPERGPPRFQMAKGTRMQKQNGVWHDIYLAAKVAGELEPLGATALREGIEELGLDITRIARLFDAGAVSFTSAKTRQQKWMWLFAAQMQGADCLLPDAHVASTTGQRLWLDLPSVRRHARPDHVSIITAMLPLLAGAVHSG